MVMKWMRQFVAGSPGWSEYLFRAPPRQPDARAVFLGGIGLITALRGAAILFGPPPAAHLFEVLGRGFIIFWALIWMCVGLFAFAMAATGHKWPDMDRAAGFLIMMLWLVWGAIYLLSAMWPDAGPDRRLIDALTGVWQIIGGIVLSAGVILSIRKTQEIGLRVLATNRIRELENDLRVMASENGRLSHELDKCQAESGDPA